VARTQLPAISTATKYRNTTTTIRHPTRSGAAYSCSVATMVATAGSSGRRGRRFKSCHPDQCHRSLTCGNAAPCGRFPTSPQPRQSPRGNKKEHEGTPGKAGADFDGQTNTRPPSTTQQTPRHSRVLQCTVILSPQRRGIAAVVPARGLAAKRAGVATQMPVGTRRRGGRRKHHERSHGVVG